MALTSSRAHALDSTRWTAAHTMLALVSLSPLIILALSPVEIIDDAYITLRYARNLARGDGLVFNVGEYVEGMTNLLWTLLLSVPARAGLAMAESAVLGGVLFGVLALLLCHRLARTLGASPAAAIGGAAALALDTHYWMTVSNGLEGGLFSFLLVATVVSLTARRPAVESGVLAGLLFMTRPETIFVAAIAVAFTLYATPDSNADTLRSARVSALKLLAAFVTVASATTLFRALYYGSLLPNSVIAKSAPAGDWAAVRLNVWHGAQYIVRFGMSTPALVLGAMLALWLRPSRALWLVVAVIGCELPAILMNGGDWMPHHRLLSVYAPLMAAAFALALDALSDRWTSSRRSQRALGSAALVVLATSALLSLGRHPWRAPQLRLNRADWLTCYFDVTQHIANVLRPEDVIASEALGLVGFELGNNYVHDPLGLTDAWIARHGSYRPGGGKLDYAYTFHAIHPEVLLVHQDDIQLNQLEAASGQRFSREYRSYAIGASAQCVPYDKPLVVSLRNDVFDRFRPSLEGLAMSRFDVR